MQDMKDANAGDIAALERLGTYPELGITPDLSLLVFTDSLLDFGWEHVDWDWFGGL